MFHVTNNGLNGLEAARVDQARQGWGCNGVNVAGVVNIASATTPDPNSGAANTPLIAVQCRAQTSVTAAVFAAVYVWPNGQRDGFLPNKEELNLLYLQKERVGGFPNFSSFGNSFYWSSSRRDTIDVWAQSFMDGTQGDTNNGNPSRVRAIRSF